MLSDTNKSIRDSAERAIQTFLIEISQRPIEVKKKELIPSTVDICIRRRTDSTKAVRSTCMHWLGEFVYWGGDALVDRFPEFIKAVIDGVQDSVGEDDEENVHLAKRLDRELQNIARSTVACENLNEKQLLKVLIQNITDKNKIVRETCLNWISLLLDMVPKRLASSTDELIPSLLGCLNDQADDLVFSSISALARIARNESNQSERILYDLLIKFDKDRNLLEQRGAFIIRKLCILLQPNVVYL